MKRANSREGERVADLDLLIAEITTDAYGDDEDLGAFLQAIQDGIGLPTDAFVTDNQGVRFLTAEVRARTAWADRRE